MYETQNIPSDAIWVEVIVGCAFLKKGAITWADSVYSSHIGQLNHSVHVEGNRYCVNFCGKRFKIIDKPKYPYPIYANFGYRFKTMDEFIRDGLFHVTNSVPHGFTQSGSMNKYIGQEIPTHLHKHCIKKEAFSHDGWGFSANSYVAISRPPQIMRDKMILDNAEIKSRLKNINRPLLPSKWCDVASSSDDFTQMKNIN